MKSWITRTLVLAMLMVCIAGVAQAQSADTTHPAGNAPVAAKESALAGQPAPKDSNDPTKGFARALDLTIETFGGHSYEELSTPEGRKKAKEELVDKLKQAYHEEVEGVYFTEFVMQ